MEPITDEGDGMIEDAHYSAIEIIAISLVGLVLRKIIMKRCIGFECCNLPRLSSHLVEIAWESLVDGEVGVEWKLHKCLKPR
jgi:hypothetical protein